MVEEALAAGFPIDAVYVDVADAEPGWRRCSVRCLRAPQTHLLADGVLAKVADTASPQGLIAVSPLPNATLDSLLATGRGADW